VESYTPKTKCSICEAIAEHYYLITNRYNTQELTARCNKHSIIGTVKPIIVNSISEEEFLTNQVMDS